MTCEHCQEYISAFLDNELDEKISAGIQTHLAVCADCAKVCEDFAVILDVCHVDETPEVLPPNSQALWCRINNIIESEIQPLQAEVKKEEPKRGWARVWQFSFGQVAAGMLFIGIVSSLLTIVGIRNYSTPAEPGTEAASQTIFEKFLGKVGLMDTPQQAREKKLKEQQAAIDYWNKRVETRRAQWDKNLREAFDRNLHEIDQTVAEYTLILQENPQDELSSEMLDSTLNDKMELLREFSDL
jgi:Putative zinc-finger